MQSKWTIMWGVVLVLFGALLLGYQMNLFGPMQLTFAVFLFGIPAVMFLLTFTFDRRQWWALIPGFVLLGLTAVVFNEANNGSSNVSGSIFLFGIAVPFWCIFFLKRWWWPIIPAGVVTTISVMPIIGTDNVLPGQLIGGIFFLGLAATFALVRLATSSDKNMAWAWWPAGILAGFGAFILLTGTVASQIFWPIVLIALGLLVLARGSWPRSHPRE